MSVRRLYALWHRSLGCGGPDSWQLITSYANRPLLFRSEAEAWAFVAGGCDRVRYEYAVTPADLEVPGETALTSGGVRA